MWKAQIIWNFASAVENFFQLWQSKSPQFVWLFIVSSFTFTLHCSWYIHITLGFSHYFFPTHLILAALCTMILKLESRGNLFSFGFLISPITSLAADSETEQLLRIQKRELIYKNSINLYNAHRILMEPNQSFLNLLTASPILRFATCDDGPEQSKKCWQTKQTNGAHPQIGSFHHLLKTSQWILLVSSRSKALSAVDCVDRPSHPAWHMNPQSHCVTCSTPDFLYAPGEISIF